MTAPVADTDEVLCACIGMGRKEAIGRLAAAPEQSFDAFLAATGAGQVCTACVLDLEYLFITAPRPESASVQARDVPVAKTSLKQRVYRQLDRFSPLTPNNRTNWMPVLYGQGIQQYLWLSNHPLLFEAGSGETGFRISYTVRDSAGRVVLRGNDALDVGGMMRVCLTQWLPASDHVMLGSIAVDRLAKRPGVRGTTRPQVEVVTRSGAASLHFQAPNRGYRSSVSFWSKPDSERTFFTAINCSKQPLKVRLSYALAETEGAVLTNEEYLLSGYECRLIEAAPPAIGDAAGALITANLWTSGYGKLHLMIADPDLSRLSLDHL